MLVTGVPFGVQVFRPARFCPEVFRTFDVCCDLIVHITLTDWLCRHIRLLSIQAFCHGNTSSEFMAQRELCSYRRHTIYTRHVTSISLQYVTFRQHSVAKLSVLLHSHDVCEVVLVRFDNVAVHNHTAMRANKICIWITTETKRFSIILKEPCCILTVQKQNKAHGQEKNKGDTFNWGCPQKSEKVHENRMIRQQLEWCVRVPISHVLCIHIE